MSFDSKIEYFHSLRSLGTRDTHRIYIRNILTHSEYDKNKRKEGINYVSYLY
jgi:hypothetical protein